MATAHVDARGARAANYALKAAVAGVDDAEAGEREREWQFERLPAHLRVAVIPYRD